MSNKGIPRITGAGWRSGLRPLPVMHFMQRRRYDYLRNVRKMPRQQALAVLRLADTPNPKDGK